MYSIMDAFRIQSFLQGVPVLIQILPPFLFVFCGHRSKTAGFLLDEKFTELGSGIIKRRRKILKNIKVEIGTKKVKHLRHIAVGGIARFQCSLKIFGLNGSVCFG